MSSFSSSSSPPSSSSISSDAAAEVPSSSSCAGHSSHSSENSQILQDAEQMKKLANDLFLAKNFPEAETLYSQALALAATDINLQVLLFTNRAAARIGMHKYAEAIADADAAIALDPQWLKAYYRKSSALEAQNLVREVYETWLSAVTVCPQSDVLVKQFKLARDKWAKLFRSSKYPVVSVEDLLRRYQLFPNKRERLSTLAHFWNDSSRAERLSFLFLLLEIISGAGALSPATLELLTAEMMIDLPLENYRDLPRERLQQWFDFYRELPSDQKKLVFRAIWDHLTAEEKNDIINDMKTLFGGGGEDDNGQEES